jgi:hypothetical protein
VATSHFNQFKNAASSPLKVVSLWYFVFIFLLKILCCKKEGTVEGSWLLIIGLIFNKEKKKKRGEKLPGPNHKKIAIVALNFVMD